MAISAVLVNVLNGLGLIANEKENTLNAIHFTNQEIADKICQVRGRQYASRTIHAVNTAMHICVSWVPWTTRTHGWC